MSTTAQDASKRLFSVEDFTAELDRVMPAMTRVARRFAPPGDAEDVTQESCLAAWRGLRHLRHSLRSKERGCRPEAPDGAQPIRLVCRVRAPRFQGRTRVPDKYWTTSYLSLIHI